MSIIHDDDLPVRMKEHQKIAHQIAEQVCNQLWNIAIDAHQKIGTQITGNDALSYMGTILQDLAGRWICLMDRIRLNDEAGISQEELVKDLLNGILTTIGANASYEEEPSLPFGIKRLEKEKNE